MANRAYLVATNIETLYPSNEEAAFAPAQQAIAQGIYCVPLLWFALFRPRDLRTQTINLDGERWELTAPLAETSMALQQLAAARPVLDQLFPEHGSLREHSQLLHAAIESTHRKFITIEWTEVEHTVESAEFQAFVRFALACFAGDVPLPVGRKSLLNLSEFEWDGPLPSARCLVDQSDAEIEVLSHLLGTCWLRPVPWEEGAH